MQAQGLINRKLTHYTLSILSLFLGAVALQREPTRPLPDLSRSGTFSHNSLLTKIGFQCTISLG
jgi:hypothetical protein